MRSTTALQDARLAAEKPRVTTRCRLFIKDDAGTWQEWTNLDGQDMVESVSWSDGTSQQHGSGEVVVRAEYYSANGIPHVTGTAWSGYLDVWREVKCEVAVVPNDSSYTVSSGEWVELFRARIDDYSVDGWDAMVSVPLRDKAGAELNDTFMHTEGRATIAADSGNDLTDWLQELLDKWDPQGRTLHVIASPSFGITGEDMTNSKGPLFKAIREAAQDSIGWDIRPLYRSGAWRLTLYEPDRTATSKADADVVFDPSSIEAITNFETTVTDIRNAVRVYYGDETSETDRGDPVQNSVVRTQATTPSHDLSGSPIAGSSIDKYGWRYMEMQTGASSMVTTQAQAERLAEAALSDLSQPRVKIDADLGRMFWSVEPNDVVAIEPDDRRFSDVQVLGVDAYSHEITAEGATTSIQLEGQPSLSRQRWSEVEGRPGLGNPVHAAQPTNLSSQITGLVAGAELVFDFPGRSDYDFHYLQVYRSTTSGFTPDNSTLVGVTDTTRFLDSGRDPNQTHYYKYKTVDASLNESPVSPELSVSPDKVPEAWIENSFTNRVPGHIGSFERYAPSSVSIEADEPPARLPWTEQRHNDAGWYDTSTDYARAPEDGVYRIEVQLVGDPLMQLQDEWRPLLWIDGVGPVRKGPWRSVSDETPSTISTDLALDDGDDVGVYVETTSSTTGVFSADAGRSSFAMTRALSNAARGGATTTYTFTNAGSTGRLGPSQSQVDSAYSGTTLDGDVTVDSAGRQEWDVPETGRYKIKAVGAQGGTGDSAGAGGEGARVELTMFLTAGTTLTIGVGQEGNINGNTDGPSGGGASWVVDRSGGTDDYFVVAGGGGGYGVGDTTSERYRAHANDTSGGSDGYGANAAGSGGTSGGGGGHGDRAGGGAGFVSDGDDGTYDSIPEGGERLNAGGRGGDVGDSTPVGGFGGGGATESTGWGACGGGGGYSGGGGGYADSSAAEGAGGGGGSYLNSNDGTILERTAGGSHSEGTGHGEVVIEHVH